MSNPTEIDGRCNAHTRDGGFCANHPVDGAERCRMHGGKGSGAPEGNFNDLQTGENVAADRWIEYIDEHADDDLRTCFAGYVEQFREQGADPVASVRLAILWSKADYNNMELLKEDFMRPLYYEGDYVTDVFDSDRDSSATSNEREARLYRREEEVSPYSQQSGGTEVLIRGDSFDANISHTRVTDDETDDAGDTDDGDVE